MTEEELKQKAENFIIDRYKLNECYREDNAETREYMRNDVHSQYEDEYQLYLDATKELQNENAELEKEKQDLEWQLQEVAKDNENYQKENAELNEKLSEQKLYTEFKCNDAVKKKEVYEREHFLLTTAKEIIREFVKWANWQGNSKCPSFKSIQDKAEQFLKDSKQEG